MMRIDNDLIMLKSSRFWTLSLMILAAAAMRLLPHWPNVTPIASIALFGGVYFSDERAAIIVPLLAMFLSDLIIGWHPLMPVVYFCFVLTVWLGTMLKNRFNPISLVGATLLSSSLFFLITNFAVWLWSSMYPLNLHGLATCYVLALPFFERTLLGDAIFTFILFGSFELMQLRLPSLRQSSANSPNSVS